MRFITILFAVIVLGCTQPLTPDPPDPPEMTVWFEDVPLERYSYTPLEYIAIQGHATVTPHDQIEWCLFINGKKNLCGESQPGEIAGQRWYLARDSDWKLRFEAVSGDVRGVSEWEWTK